LRHVKDTTTVTVLAEDTASLMGNIVAALGVFLSSVTGNPVYDAAASIVIGVILALIAFGLMYQSKQMLIGERIVKDKEREIRSFIQNDPDVAEVKELLTMHLGPNDILVNAALRFKEASNAQLASSVQRLRERVTKLDDGIARVFIQPLDKP